MMKSDELTSRIIGAAMRVHRELGPGLLESIYQSCLCLELGDEGVRFESEVALPVHYRGRVVAEQGLRLDLLVEDRVVVELKSVEKVQAVHYKQVLSYLKLAKKPVGLLINFNEVLLKNGITRLVSSS